MSCEDKAQKAWLKVLKAEVRYGKISKQAEKARRRHQKALDALTRQTR